MKINRFLITFAAIAMSMAANAASLPIGYCFGAIAEKGQSKVGNATISAAIVFPEEMLRLYEGATVTGIRVGLVTAEGVTNLRGWIRTDLEADNMDETGFQDASAGWNEAPLDAGIVIGGSQLVAGFSFQQEKSVKCISVTGENNDNARWIAKNGKWELAKAYGALSVELMISDDDLPESDIQLVSLDSPRMPVRSGHDMTFQATVRNNTFSDADGFNLSYSVDGEKSAGMRFDGRLAYGEKTTVSFTIPSGAIPDDTPCLMDVEVSCDGDFLTDNNRASMKIGSYTASLPRKVLLEEFTTEKCGNCPRAINTIKQCEEAGYADRMVVVAHHVGYYTDWLTVPDDEVYLWLYDPYGKNGTFAPAAMLDRTVLPGEEVPVNSVGYFKDFEPLLKDAAGIPAFVKIDVATSFTGSDNLSIGVDIEKLPVLDVASDMPRLTVYIIEDGIPHRNQAGITSDTFTHSHVFRKCVTDLWGTPIEWDGNTSHCDFSVELDKEWNRDNISVVAFVNDYTYTDIDRCRVHNSTVARAGYSGVDTTCNDSRNPVSTTYTTLSGTTAGSGTTGFLIKTEVWSDGTIRTSKVIRK